MIKTKTRDIYARPTEKRQHDKNLDVKKKKTKKQKNEEATLNTEMMLNQKLHERENGISS